MKTSTQIGRNAPDPGAAVALREWDKRTLGFLAEKGFAPRGAALVIAVSGGADSTALLDFWSRFASGFECGLQAVHVHHGLRATADRDQAAVEALCRTLGVPLSTFRLHPQGPGGRRPGESTEMWARRERYRCFAEAASTAATGMAASIDAAAATAADSASGIDAAAAPAQVFVLTAHHQGDLVETVFQRLGRGTGPRGLSGIPFRRALNAQAVVVRPFLNRSRADILAYLGMRGLIQNRDWNEDESNADVRIGRNWYRHRYLPSLRLREPDLDARVFFMAMAMQSLGAGLDGLEDGERLLRHDAAGEAFLPVEAVAERLSDGDLLSLRYWLGKLAEAAGFPSHLVTPEILRELRRQWSASPLGVAVPLGRELFLKRRNHGFYWEKTGATPPTGPARGHAAKKSCPPEEQRVILDHGTGSIAWRWNDQAFTLTARRYPRPAKLDFPGAGEHRAIFDADLISCTLGIRTRKAGDRFSPFGVRSRSRKLKVFLNEKKIPSGARDRIPLIFSADGASDTLAWVPGYGISDSFKVGAQTTLILELVIACEI